MKVEIHMPCYNEALILEDSIHHYRSRFPDATFHIYDNHSTDASRDIAKSLGCRVTTWGEPDELDLNALTDIQNNLWKSDTAEWVIMCDIDEWICITEEQLREEDLCGTTVIRTLGYNMVGDSERNDLADISLHGLRKGVYSDWYCKRSIFNAKHITEMNYGHGQHWCSPTGNTVESMYSYVLKHMDFLGKKYRVNKNKKSYVRSERQRRLGKCGHHLADDSEIERRYDQMVADAVEVDFTRQK